MPELTKDKITILVNHFVRVELKFGFADEKTIVALFEHDDGWSLETVPKHDSRLKEAKTRFTLPSLPDDEMDAAIELAGFLSVKLNNYIRAKRAASGRSAEVKSRAGKIAAEARWKKYKK